MITWHLYDRETAPRDRPIGLLSVQWQENIIGYVAGEPVLRPGPPLPDNAYMISLHVGMWKQDGAIRGGDWCDDSCHVLGLNFDSNVGDNCATHWCELTDLTLPIFPPESDAAYRCRILEKIDAMSDLDRYAAGVATGTGLDTIGQHVNVARR